MPLCMYIYIYLFIDINGYKPSIIFVDLKDVAKDDGPREDAPVEDP